MPTRSSKLPRDPNQLAAHIVAMSTGQEPPAPKNDQEDDTEELDREISEAAEKIKKEDAPKEKNPAAVALGRLGGMKGGKARAEKLTSDERAEIASRAAKTRWSKRDRQISSSNKS